MSTPTEESNEADWNRAVMERRRRTPSTNTNTSSDISSAIPTNPNNTPTDEGREMISRSLAKTAAMEAAEYANAKAAHKESLKQKDINYIKSGKASPLQMEKFKSIYHDDIREEVEGAKHSADKAVSEMEKRKSPNTPRSSATTPIPIPVKNRPHSYIGLGGRTKRRSTKRRKTRKGKRVQKSKKAKKAHRSKKYKRKSRKR